MNAPAAARPSLAPAPRPPAPRRLAGAGAAPHAAQPAQAPLPMAQPPRATAEAQEGQMPSDPDSNVVNMKTMLKHTPASTAAPCRATMLQRRPPAPTAARRRVPLLPISPVRAVPSLLRLPVVRQAVVRRQQQRQTVKAALSLPLISLVSKALLAGAAASWARAKVRAFVAGLEELFRFSPHRLQTEYLSGTGETGPLEARRYTLTHCDRTGHLQLSIGNEWNGSQLAGWYKALLRDEVLAEWRGASAARLLNEPATIDGHPAALPSLHIYCHITAAVELAGKFVKIAWPPAPPALRSHIFQKDMPIVLAALAYAERRLLEASPLLAAAPVYVHLRSHHPDWDRVVHWGRLGDPSSWRPHSHTPPMERPVTL